jgi:hypothetical protein
MRTHTPYIKAYIIQPPSEKLLQPKVKHVLLKLREKVAATTPKYTGDVDDDSQDLTRHQLDEQDGVGQTLKPPLTGSW